MTSCRSTAKKKSPDNGFKEIEFIFLSVHLLTMVKAFVKYPHIFNPAD
jgi:hypothetical protein